MAPLKERKKFFLFDTPMSASGREDTLLGVAFEKPTEGTLEGFTPQGPRVPKQESEITPSTWDNLSRNLRSWNLGLGGPTEPRETPPATPTRDAQADKPFGEYDYRSPCLWPKDLVEKVYPNESTDAAGVQKITQRIRDANLRNRILDAITLGLGYDENDLDTIIIPILRRHSTEDPWGMVRDLLHKTEYRERFINLCKLKQSSKRKTLYVATGLIACEGVSFDRMRKEEQELGGHVGDPTHTVPLNIGGRLHHLKRSTVKGGYQSPIILCMSYRKVEYECVTRDSKPSLWTRFTSNGHDVKSSAGATWIFDREDGMQDAFWVPDHDHKGEIPAFMSPEDSPEDNQVDGSKPAIFEHSDLCDASAGAQESDDEDGDVVSNQSKS